MKINFKDKIQELGLKSGDLVHVNDGYKWHIACIEKITDKHIYIPFFGKFRFLTDDLYEDGKEKDFFFYRGYYKRD